jgi:hypothetical protein
MLKTTNKKTLRNLFIFSTSMEERVNQKIQHLTYQARQAYYACDYRQVTECSEELLNLSPRSEFAGLYFQALAISQYGNNKSNEAVQIYEMLAKDAPHAIQSAAMLALGLNASRSNQLDEARRLLTEAYQMGVLNQCAPITTLHTQSALSALYSQQGEHHKSALILKNILPEVFKWGRVFPTYLGDELNNYAYELCQLSEFQAASQIISGVLSMPIAYKHPEWQETAREIHEAQAKSRRNPSPVHPPEEKNLNVVNIANYKREPSSTDQEAYVGKVVRFPTPKNSFQLKLTSHDDIFNFLCNLDIDDSQESEERLMELLYLLNFLCTDSESDYIVRGFVSPENSGLFKFEGNIHSSELGKLLTLIGNVEAYARSNPLPGHRHKFKDEPEVS